MKKFETEYGYFSEDGQEYIITNPHTPRPWVNVISNGKYGLVISQVNGGFSWLENSNLNRLTRWHQDLIMDNWGKFIYLRDEESGEYWSPTLQPVPVKLENYICRHGIGYSYISSSYKKLTSDLRVFVPLENNLEVWTLTLKNESDQIKKIAAFTYLEWLLGAAPDNHREFHKVFIETEFENDHEILLAAKQLWEVPAERGHWNTDWPYTAYFFCDLTIDSYECDKESFVGIHHDISNPLALQTGELKKQSGRWNDPIAAVKKSIELKPGEEFTINFFLGVEQDRQKVVELAETWRAEKIVETAFKNVINTWEKYLSRTVVETPDEALNFMTNTWLKYQTISGRIWGRAAYYQQSGAYGFRDQLQDSQIFLYSDPQLTKEQILLHAAHQFTSGKVLHWWHPLTEQGLSTEMTDDLLWLPFVISQYIKETADWDILQEKVPYYDDKNDETLLQHSIRAIDLVLNRFSDRGLPLILGGDWNDGLSAVGLEGKGESIWLAEFLYKVIGEMIFILEKVGDLNHAVSYKNRREQLALAVNEHGWDGAWFRRATKDDGSFLGSCENKEGQIFLNPQIWAIISAISTPERMHQAMQSAIDKLECNVGMQLFSPAYSKADKHIGYLSRYAPGVRENGGVYTHAATWTIWAANLLNNPELAYRIYKKLCPVYNGMSPDQYSAEPYVTPGSIDGRDSPYYGRGGWTWYTGSAAWLFRVTIDHILGIQADFDGLRVNPCLPTEWEQVKLKRYFRGVIYNIVILNNKNLSHGKVEIIVDDQKIEDNLILHQNNATECDVIIYIGIN
jgi:cellobiose phosphorylase